MIMDKSDQLIKENPENLSAKEIFFPNITTFLSIFNEGFSISSTTLFFRHYSDNITAVENGDSGCNVLISKLIFGNTSGLLRNLLKSLFQLLQTSYKPFINNKSVKKVYSLLYLRSELFPTLKSENKIFKTHSSFRRNFLFLFSRINFLKPSFFDPVIL